MANLTVAMDARYLAGERKGIGRYCHTLLAGVSTLPDPPAFIFITDREFEAAYPGLACETRVIEAWPVYSWEQIRLPRLLRRLDADLFHAPGNALPLRPPRPTVLTLHDMMMFERGFHTGEANRYYLYQSWLLRRAVRKCEAVITVSRTSAEDIRKRLGPAATANLTVIEEAVDPIFFEDRSAQELTSFRGRLGLPERYLLHLGAAFPRKNTRLTIEAYKLASASQELPPLVIGGVAARDEPTLRAWAEEAGLGGRLHLQPYLPPADHASLVAAAEALVYPSAYEGFGLPALEAMAVGVPVIASRRGALPETCGEAAHYVEPEVGELAEALQFLTSENERRRLAEAGRRRVAEFSPARMAERTVEVYREAVAAAKS
jgi:glycosyltransferase involved in cell wall biosynthesis